jgi:tetratricopeptide (TPR) repeat protein
MQRRNCKTIYFPSILFSLMSVVFLLNTFGQNVSESAKKELEQLDKTEQVERYKAQKPKFNVQNCEEDQDCIIARETKYISKGTKGSHFSDYHYELRGIAYYKKQKYEAALKDFEQIEGRQCANIYLGNIYVMKGKYDEAYSIFSILIQQRPNYAEAYLGRGIVLNHLKNYQLALENYDNAIFFNAILSKAYYHRGINYVNIADELAYYGYDKSEIENNYKKALKDFDAVEKLEINNTSAELYLNRSNVYAALGEKEKAKIEQIKFDEKATKP